MLVAAKSIVNNTNVVKTVPRMPTSSCVDKPQMHAVLLLRNAKYSVNKNSSAIPKNTQRKTGDIAIVAE